MSAADDYMRWVEWWSDEDADHHKAETTKGVGRRKAAGEERGGTAKIWRSRGGGGAEQSKGLTTELGYFYEEAEQEVCARSKVGGNKSRAGVGGGWWVMKAGPGEVC